MIIFNHPHDVDMPAVDLDEGESRFVNDIDPNVMTLVGELGYLVSEKTGKNWILTPMEANPWLHVMKGPTDGIGWHDEGIRDDNFSVVYALNDSSAALEFESCVLEHKKGRAVMFKSSTKHRVQRLEDKECRYALAFLLHGGDNA